MSCPPRPEPAPPPTRPQRGADASGDGALDDWPAPPVSFCATCGRTECAGCLPENVGAVPFGLPWEQSHASALSRLWETATIGSLEPERTFAGLPEGRVAPALGFAFAAETLALGSVALCIVGSLALLAPATALELLDSRPVQVGASLALIGSILLMVALHALWGYCLEAGAQRGARTPLGAASRAQGLRFGLYACGWDLLTSPAGVLHGLVSRGPLGLWSPLIAAARAPRAALHAYLGGCRALDAEARREALRRSTRTLAVALLILIAAMGLTAIAIARWLGY
jgi:hypothetical protein